MRVSRARIENKLGFHLRAVTQIAEIAGRFDCRITFAGGAHPDQPRNARSVLDLMLLEAQCGDEMTVSAEGPDEDQALTAMLDLFARRFGEE